MASASTGQKISRTDTEHHADRLVTRLTGTIPEGEEI